jgi:FixJ family two-component response regulator
VTDREATVFVVDDDLSVRRGLARLLRSAGYRVATFASAREFLAEGKVDGPSCLVLDIRMPGQSGLDLHEVLIADDQQVPVVFITGHGDIPLAARAKKSGAVDFLAKPFDDRTLLGAVQQAIAGSLRTGQNDHPMPKR